MVYIYRRVGMKVLLDRFSVFVFICRDLFVGITLAQEVVGPSIHSL